MQAYYRSRHRDLLSPTPKIALDGFQADSEVG